MPSVLGTNLLAEVAGAITDFFEKLGGPDGTTWLAEFKKFLRKEPCWANGQVAQATQPKPISSILEFISTVKVSATTSKFVAKDKFVVNTKRNAPVKISYLGDNFTEWFLSGSGKTEDPISEQTLCYHKLRQSSVDSPIITELGGEAKAETTLSEMFSLMEKQKNGEDGVLLNNGYANIFYTKDKNGVLRAVFVYWNDDGWGVIAYSFEYPYRWSDGRRVFSRNSVLESSEPSALAQA